MKKEEEYFSLNLARLLLLEYEHIFYACYNYHQEGREKKREEEYAVCSFISLSLNLSMMMFRTVLFFFFFFLSIFGFFSSSFSFFFYITQRKKKDRRIFEGRQDVLAGSTVRIEQHNSNVPFSLLLSLTKLLLRFPISFFLLVFFSMHYTHNCVYSISLCIFLKFSLRSIFLELVQTKLIPKKRMETRNRLVCMCIHIFMKGFFLLSLPLHSIHQWNICVCVQKLREEKKNLNPNEYSLYFLSPTFFLY